MFVIYFISQWMKTSKHGLSVFPPEETLTWRWRCSIGQSCSSLTSKRSIALISRKFSGMNYFYPSVTKVCIRLINQSNRSISVRLLFLFCSRVFISTSYDIRKLLYRRQILVTSLNITQGFSRQN